ncbi:MAG: NADH oxidase, partial [Erysipelotrichia bacterium]|nr:NADH oxidase [Erysipelotrichia bacterium]
MSKIIVVGANHAGTAAINTILDNYQGHEVIVFDSNSNISFLGCGMALWIGKQIDGAEGLFYANKQQLENKGAKIYMETLVERIDYEEKVVHAKGKDGKTYTETYDKLILATGSLPIVPAIEGVNLKNVQQVKLYQNAQDVIAKLEDDSLQNIVVVGGGYIGVELAEAFERCHKKVTLIDCANTCLSSYYDETLTNLMNDNLKTHGINLAFNEKVIRLEGKDRVEKVITDKHEYKADMVILAIGFKANNQLGKDALTLFKNGAYLVDKTQKTSLDDVYAIGDCATVYDNAINDVNYIALATNAVRSGIIAAHNACGTKLESVGVQGSNGISIYGFNMVSTGLTLAKAKQHGFDATMTSFHDYQKPGFIKQNEMVDIVIVYDKQSRRILGAQMASFYDLSMGIHMFSLAIQEQMSIDKLKLLDIFFLPHFNQPYNYIT